jgi:hypothetical protein
MEGQSKNKIEKSLKNVYNWLEYQNYCSHRDTCLYKIYSIFISYGSFTLAKFVGKALGSTAQIGSFLFQSLGQGK